MHRTNRCERSGRRTHSRGFTLIELGVAVFIFSIIAGVITLAVARAQISAGADRFRRGAETELDAMLAIAATGSFNDIVDGTFVRPDACDEATHLSCPSVLGRTVRVRWTVNGIEDLAALSSENPVGVVLSAASTLPNGVEIFQQRFVPAPNAGRDGTALVRIRLAGQAYDGPLYLLGADDSVVGSTVVTNMTGLIRAAVDACSIDAPCRLALRPDGDAIDEDVSLDWSNVAGPGVVLANGVITETSAQIRPLQELHVLLLAENSSGRRAWAPHPGSVCLYLNIVVEETTVSVPGCNTESADRVIWRSFEPIPGSGVSTALAHGDLSLSTDPLEGTCQAAGQLGWDDGSWQDAMVCTSWTWGPFSEVRNGLTGTEDPLETATFTLSGTSTRYVTAVWTSDGANALGVPAAGYDGDPQWAKPRDVPACAQTSSCTAVVASPEAGCLSAHCRSSTQSAPLVNSPLLGAYNVTGVQVAAGEDTTFDIVVRDSEDDDVTVTVVDAPGNVRLCDSPLTCAAADAMVANDVLVDNQASPASFPVTLEAGVGFTGDELVLSISDGTNTRIERIALTVVGQSATVRELHLAPVRVRQSNSTVARFVAIGSDGDGMIDGQFTAQTPTGVTFGTPVHGGAGQYSVTLSADTTVVVGVNSFTLNAGSVNDSAAIDVLATAGSLSVTGDELSQGSTATVTVTLLDTTDEPLADRQVWFRLSAGGAGIVPLGTYPTQRGCVTDQNSTCSVAIIAESAAVPGTFTVTAYSGDITGTATLTVTSAIGRIASDGAQVEQGDRVEVTITAYDGRGEPAGGVAFTASSATAGTSVTGSGTTAADGTTTLTLQTTTSTPVGTVVVTVDDGTNTHQVRVRVTSTVTTIDVPASVSLAQRGNAAFTITVRNAQGATAPLSTVSFVAPEGISIPSSVMTDTNGQAQVSLSASSTRALGETSVSIRYDGNELGTLNVTVIRGVDLVVLDGVVDRSGTSAVSLVLTDSNGEVVSGRSVALSPSDARITVSPPTAVTNLLGYSSHTIDAAAVPAGTYNFVVDVDGRRIPLQVVIR